MDNLVSGTIRQPDGRRDGALPIANQLLPVTQGRHVITTHGGCTHAPRPMPLIESNLSSDRAPPE